MKKEKNGMLWLASLLLFVWVLIPATTFAGEGRAISTSTASTSTWVCPCNCSGDDHDNSEWHNLAADSSAQTTVEDCNKKFVGDSCEPPAGGKIVYCGKPKWVKDLAEGYEQ